MEEGVRLGLEYLTRGLPEVVPWRKHFLETCPLGGVHEPARAKGLNGRVPSWGNF
jgi:hypothetical protein